MDTRTAISWSGGKGSALALAALRRQGVRPRALVATVTDPYDRVSLHGVRPELLRRQAAALGLPLVEVPIELACPNEAYDARMEAAFGSPPLVDVASVAFGDVVERFRAYREERLARGGRKGLFPLWGRHPAALAGEFLAAGFEAVVVCVDPRVLDGSFTGRPYDETFLADLPSGVDPGGANGEFHTFVHSGPIFSRPVAYDAGEVVERDGFVLADLVPA